MIGQRSDFLESRDWLDLRYRALKKHGGSCQLCGSRGSEDNPIQVDHIKPRSTHPHLALAEDNLQVLCKACNFGKSNRDDTDWRFKASSELTERVNRKRWILQSATGLEKAKLQQLAWLRKNEADLQIRKEADRQYRTLWSVIEESWIAQGKPK